MVLYKKLSASDTSEEDLGNYKDMLIGFNHDTKQAQKGCRSNKDVGLISS